MLHATRHRLLQQAEHLATSKIDFYLLREPHLAAAELAHLAREIRQIFNSTPTRLLLHNRPDIAVAVHAHGVHLPSNPGALTPAQVRTVFSQAGQPSPTVSLSCHTQADILRARTLQPDLILFGPVFGKTIARQLITAPTGLEALRQACRLAAPIAVLALGGVTHANTPACLEAGGAGVAAIRLFRHPSQASPSG